MSHARVVEWLDQNAPRRVRRTKSAPSRKLERVVNRPILSDGGYAARRTPRMSVIVVLPEDQIIEPDLLGFDAMSPIAGDVEVTVACAGAPSNLEALKRHIRNARFLLAPSGTSGEELRELAMEETPGDIIKLVDGASFSALAGRATLIGD